MSRVTFNAELGFGINALNGDELVKILSGTLTPDGTSGQQSIAPIGSLYLRSGTGELYQKIANAGNASDWQLNGSSSATIGKWRPESVVLTTDEAQAPGVRDVVANPFTDDDGTAVALSEYVVGEYIIADSDGTPVLLEITDVTANNVTFAAASSPLVAEDTFVTKFYLPDSPDSQEGRAIVNFNGSVIIKLADIDFGIATGINLSSSYAAAAGNPLASDTVEAAIAKLDGNNDAQDTLLGTAQGDTNLGTFAGSIISDNNTVKGALSELEAEIESVEALANGSPQVETGVSTATILDSLLVDQYRSAVWLVTGFDEANPQDAKSQIIHGVNDGTASADAASVDDNKFSLNSTGAFNFQVSVVLNGSGTSQTMDLEVNTSEPGVTFSCVRLGAAPSGY